MQYSNYDGQNAIFYVGLGDRLCRRKVGCLSNAAVYSHNLGRKRYLLYALASNTHNIPL